MRAIEIFASRATSRINHALTLLLLPRWHRQLDKSNPQQLFTRMRISFIVLISTTFALLSVALFCINLNLASYSFWIINMSIVILHSLIILTIRFFPIHSPHSAYIMARVLSWVEIAVFTYRTIFGFWWLGGISSPGTIWYTSFVVILAAALLTPTQIRWFLLFYFVNILVIFLLVDILNLGGLDKRVAGELNNELVGILTFATFVLMTAVCPWTAESKLLINEVRALHEHEAVVKGETLSVVMHETANPLHRAFLLLDAVAEEERLPPHRLDPVRTALRSVSSSLDRLLDYVNLESAHFPLVSIVFPLFTLVAQIQQSVQQKAHTLGFTLCWAQHDVDRVVVGDRRRVIQVVESVLEYLLARAAENGDMRREAKEEREEREARQVREEKTERERGVGSGGGGSFAGDVERTADEQGREQSARGFEEGRPFMQQTEVISVQGRQVEDEKTCGSQSSGGCVEHAPAEEKVESKREQKHPGSESHVDEIRIEEGMLEQRRSQEVLENALLIGPSLPNRVFQQDIGGVPRSDSEERGHGSLCVCVKCARVLGRQCELRVLVVVRGLVIPEQEKSRLFDVFNPAVGLTPGMSLSLTVARLIARLMGGSLSVRDVLDRDVSWAGPCLPGTVFAVRLPLKLADEGAQVVVEEAKQLEMRPILPLFPPQPLVLPSPVPPPPPVRPAPPPSPVPSRPPSTATLPTVVLLPSPPCLPAPPPSAEVPPVHPPRPPFPPPSPTTLVCVAMPPPPARLVTPPSLPPIPTPVPTVIPSPAPTPTKAHRIRGPSITTPHSLTLTMLLDSHPHLSLLRPYHPLCVPLSTSVKCLVVDDVLLNRRLTSRQLIRLGARVDTAESGEEAIRMCEQSVRAGEPYHLILMDVVMPGLDGIESTRRLRLIGGLESTVIIGLTANVTPDVVRALHASGADDVLAKPANSAQLKEKLDLWVRREAECASEMVSQ